MIRQELLRILRCPLTREPLQPADPALLARLNEAIAAGQVVNRLGEPVRRALDGGLVNQAGTHLYAIRDDIPCMIADESIDLGPWAGGP